MALPMTRPFKKPSGIYWLRKRVPEDLQTIIGKREILRTLGTRDPAEAKRLLAEALVELETQWANLRRGPQTLMLSQCHELAQSIYDEMLQRYAEDPAAMTIWDPVIGQRLWQPDELPANPRTFADYFAVPPDWFERQRQRDLCTNAADQLLAHRGLVVDEDSKRRLAEAVSAAMNRACRALEGLRNGDQIPAPGLIVPSSKVSARVPSAPNAHAGCRLKELYTLWLEEKKPEQKTAYAWGRVVDKLASFLGDKDISDITPDDLQDWKTSLVKAGLEAKTIRDGKLAPVRALMGWALRNRKLSSNPAQDLTIDVKTKTIDLKRGYTDEEAQKLLTLAASEAIPHRQWVTWVCAYTGARVSEVCQLRAEDVLELKGIPCIRIKPEAGSVKNAGSERDVPLHSALIEQGFLDFARSIPNGPIFHELTPDRFGSRGGNAVKLLSRWVRSQGFSDPRISPNHSWRHRLRTQAREHGLAIDIVDAITGHARRTVADRYGVYPITALKRELEKIPAVPLLKR